jgi:hypothetical protein
MHVIYIFIVFLTTVSGREDYLAYNDGIITAPKMRNDTSVLMLCGICRTYLSTT